MYRTEPARSQTDLILNPSSVFEKLCGSGKVNVSL